MRDTGFRPGPALIARIAPTEKRRGQMSYLGDTGVNAGADGEVWLRGEVHDPTSYRMNGVAGHAGLFSTANDLAIYCQMILNGGTYRGVRILAPLTVAEMTRPRVVASNGATRGLGWDINTTFSTNRGDLFPLGSFGHTGFTGTSMWIDPASEMFVVFLSNRVHPDGKGDVGPLRGRVASIVAASVTDTAAVERAREQSAKYYNELVRSLQQFAFRSEGAGSSTKVLTGIDVLERDNFKQLAGMRLGLVTNHTGRNREGRQTIDVLSKAPGVKLVALFSPEHGIRGLADEKDFRLERRSDRAADLFALRRDVAGRSPSSSKISTRSCMTFRTSARASTLTSPRSVTCWKKVRKRSCRCLFWIGQTRSVVSTLKDRLPIATSSRSLRITRFRRGTD